MADIVSTSTTKAVEYGRKGVVYEFDYSILPQYAAWNAATNYAVDTIVSRATPGRLYKALVGGVDATAPEDALTGETPLWEDIGPIASPVYLVPNLSQFEFSGNASLHLVQTAGQVTIQIQSDNSGTDANFKEGYNTSDTVHPAICTNLAFASTPNKFFEGIAFPYAARNRVRFSNSHATVTATGKAYLYLSRG